MDTIDPPTRALVRLAACVAGGDEAALRGAIAAAAGATPAEGVEELRLQSYNYCAFPRTPTAMRDWRRSTGVAAPPADADATSGAVEDWRARGEETCATVYGALYAPLRRNVRVLHPALDEWMVVDGYGKILSRPGLDLARRELCIVAACSVTRQDRQLHSHFHGALNAGATPEAVLATLDEVSDMITADTARAHVLLFRRVHRK
jgi:4-carboxymuconolactone decarboxylase